MAVDCSASNLATVSNCFLELSWKQRQAIRVYAYCQSLGAVDCTAQGLATNANCFLDLPWRTRQAIRVYAFCSKL